MEPDSGWKQELTSTEAILHGTCPSASGWGQLTYLFWRVARGDSANTARELRDPAIRAGSRSFLSCRTAAVSFVGNSADECRAGPSAGLALHSAIADVDLYIPILKYVFGEAQMGGPCAVVSTFRLRQEFYGLDRDVLRQRLLKESSTNWAHTRSSPLPGLPLRHGIFPRG